MLQWEEGESGTDPLLAARFAVPRLPDGFVRRTRLLTRLDKGLERALVLVNGPAGVGKSLLVADWAARTSADQVVWLTAEREDNVPAVFWARVLQALYAWEMRGGKNLDRVATQVWDDLAVAPEERRIAGILVREVSNCGPELDSRLAELTTNWRLERLGAIERSVLRLGAAELMKGDTPPRVAIQEAVRLAERFGTSASAKFVNGVLDAFARQAGMI